MPEPLSMHTSCSLNVCWMDEDSSVLILRGDGKKKPKYTAIRVIEIVCLTKIKQSMNQYTEVSKYLKTK